MRTAEPAILVRGARTHNLRGIDCRVPHGRVTVVTGPSGAGKSSLALDTVYAEGQRRYAESMSTWVQQFLDPAERPPVDSLEGVLPAVALEARNPIRNARATVGTQSEVQDLLRLLFVHAGERACTQGHGVLRRMDPQTFVEELQAGAVGESFLLLAVRPRPARGASTLLAELVRQGYRRALDEDGELLDLEGRRIWPRKLDPLDLVIGRFRTGGSSSRLAEAVDEALALQGARVRARGPAGELHGAPGLVCPRCGESAPPPSPALFSFDSPLGACATCQGYGRVLGIDAARVIPDPSRSLAQGPIAPWNTATHDELYEKLYAACRARGVPTDVPWQNLPEEAREWIWNGGGGVPRFVSLRAFFARLERRSYRVHMRVMLARYRSYDLCPDCRGSRLAPEALQYTVAGRRLPELAALSLGELASWVTALDLPAAAGMRAADTLRRLSHRLAVLERVGLGYLTADRQARTLSGGEAQRIQLGTALGSGLTSTLYVLDEPTIGLHPRDSGRLLDLLRDLAAAGNTVLVVEHDRRMIEGADHLIDLGPRAGEHGGRLMGEGPPAAVLANPDSLTARYLRPPVASRARAHRQRHRRERGWARRLRQGPAVEILGARAHNLRGFDLRLPLRGLVAVTGVSGSGKSSLIENVLYGTYKRERGVVDVEPGECAALRGVEALEDISLVDQRPLGRSKRSNPVTYVDAYGPLRALYARTVTAQRRGITAGHFSFNRELGRCPECKGNGVIEVDMQFLAPVSVVCEACGGRRFQRRVLEVRHQGRSIAEALELTVDEALELYAEEVALIRPLRTLAAVGLGYLRLGQATSTLSGGEAQRLKLATYLDRPRRAKAHLFLFDEPTTGLHLADIDRLHDTLRRLLARGDGVVLVEHNLDLIARCDWIVELGPEGGDQGGELLFTGPIDDFLADGTGATAVALREHLRRARGDRDSRTHRR